jgi:small-conductance mechanosensitive channel
MMTFLLQTETPFKLMDILLKQVESMMNFLPNLIGFFVILLIGWIIAKIVSRIVKKVLGSIGIDKLARRLNEIDLIQKTNIEIVPSVLLSKLLYYLIFFIFIIAATEVLKMQAVSDLMAGIMNYIPKVISAVFVFLIGIFIADALKNIVLTACKSLAIPAAGIISNAVFYFLLLNIIMITLKQADLQTDFMEQNISIILAGIILAFALGYGLASQSLMSNFIASFYNKHKIKIGDTIGIDGKKGSVIQMDNNSITLKTSEKRMIIPLSKLNTETLEIFE